MKDQIEENGFRRYSFLGMLLVSSVVLAACTSMQLVPPPPSSRIAATVNVTDKREPAEKMYRRDGVLSSVQYFGDDDFDPTPIAQVARLLAVTLPAGEHELSVTKLRLMDEFPRRMSVGLLVATGATYMPVRPDRFTCVAEGSINGNSFSASSMAPYELSVFSTVIRNDSSYLAAANQCIKSMVEQMVTAQ